MFLEFLWIKIRLQFVDTRNQTVTRSSAQRRHRQSTKPTRAFVVHRSIKRENCRHANKHEYTLTRHFTDAPINCSTDDKWRLSWFHIYHSSGHTTWLIIVYTALSFTATCRLSGRDLIEAVSRHLIRSRAARPPSSPKTTDVARPTHCLCAYDITITLFVHCCEDERNDHNVTSMNSMSCRARDCANGVCQFNHWLM